MAVPLRIPKSISDREIAYQYMKDAILHDEIGPNERIVETEFAEKLNVSRTPIREALRLLEKDGLIICQPKKGARVRQRMTREEIEEVFTIRNALQMLSIDATLQNATDADLKEMERALQASKKALAADDMQAFLEYHDEFNMVLVKSCRMRYLIQIMIEMENYSPVVSFMGVSGLPSSAVTSNACLLSAERRVDALKEHEQIYHTLKLRDRDGFVEAMQKHIVNTKLVIMESIQ